MQNHLGIFFIVTVFSGATILSGKAGYAAAQEPTPCAAHKKLGQHANTQRIAGESSQHSSISPQPKQNAVTTRLTRPLFAAPPLVNKVKPVGHGSISPINGQTMPQAGHTVGEVEPIILVADIKPPAPSTAPVSVNGTPDGWEQVLSRYAARDGQGLVRFDYQALQASQTDLQKLAGYIAALSAKTPSTMSKNQAMAYWANLYNALTVQVVAQNYPVKSIRDIKSGRRKGPWKRKLVNVEGKDLTLDNIEHDIMRPTYKTPLVHYMVNCASIGCPNLKTSPWQAGTLQVDMEAAARAYINSERGVKFERNTLQASRIYRWFKKDFGNSEIGVLAHLKQYADQDLRQKLETRTKIDKYGYDWALNAPNN